MSKMKFKYKELDMKKATSKRVSSTYGRIEEGSLNYLIGKKVRFKKYLGRPYDDKCEIIGFGIPDYLNIRDRTRVNDTHYFIDLILPSLKIKDGTEELYKSVTEIDSDILFFLGSKPQIIMGIFNGYYAITLLSKLIEKYTPKKYKLINRLRYMKLELLVKSLSTNFTTVKESNKEMESFESWVWFELENQVYCPPDGRIYGFPKEIPESIKLGKKTIRDWLLENNYPEKDVDFALEHGRILG